MAEEEEEIENKFGKLNDTVKRKVKKAEKDSFKIPEEDLIDLPEIEERFTFSQIKDVRNKTPRPTAQEMGHMIEKMSDHERSRPTAQQMRARIEGEAERREKEKRNLYNALTEGRVSTQEEINKFANLSPENIDKVINDLEKNTINVNFPELYSEQQKKLQDSKTKQNDEIPKKGTTYSEAEIAEKLKLSRKDALEHYEKEFGHLHNKPEKGKPSVSTFKESTEAVISTEQETRKPETTQSLSEAPTVVSNTELSAQSTNPTVQSEPQLSPTKSEVRPNQIPRPEVLYIPEKDMKEYRENLSKQGDLPSVSTVSRETQEVEKPAIPPKPQVSAEIAIPSEPQKKTETPSVEPRTWVGAQPVKLSRQETKPDTQSVAPNTLIGAQRIKPTVPENLKESAQQANVQGTVTKPEAPAVVANKWVKATVPTQGKGSIIIGQKTSEPQKPTAQPETPPKPQVPYVSPEAHVQTQNVLLESVSKPKSKSLPKRLLHKVNKVMESAKTKMLNRKATKTKVTDAPTKDNGRSM